MHVNVKPEMILISLMNNLYLSTRNFAAELCGMPAVERWSLCRHKTSIFIKYLSEPIKVSSQHWMISFCRPVEEMVRREWLTI